MSVCPQARHKSSQDADTVKLSQSDKSLCVLQITSKPKGISCGQNLLYLWNLIIKHSTNTKGYVKETNKFLNLK